MNKLSVLVGLLAGGCYIVEPDPLCNDPRSCVPPPSEVVDVLTTTPNLDLLIVVDDSGSMIEKQASFRAALPALLDQLAAIPGGLPNLHLGVVSSDMGTSALDGQTAAPIGTVGTGGCLATGKGGAFQRGTATLAGEDHFVTLSRDGAKNFEGDLVDTLGQMASLGSTGCGMEQPLAAVHAALSGGLPQNAGFVRPGANLAVLVLTDEDDCSAEHTSLFGPDSPQLGALQSFRCFRFGVSCDQDTSTVGAKTNCQPASGSLHVTSPDPLAEALLATKQDPRRVMFGGIVGVPDTAGTAEVVLRTQNGAETPAVDAACRFLPTGGSVPVTADPAIRLTAFADNFAVSRIESICSEDLTPQATGLGSSIAAMMNDTCVPAQFVEATCFVEDHRDADPTYARTLRSCDLATGVGGDCFRFVPDTSCGSGQRLAIARPVPAVGDEWSTLRCNQ